MRSTTRGRWRTDPSPREACETAPRDRVGRPGSGKTTLAAILAQRLSPPLLARDELKEAIADAILPAAPLEADRRPEPIDPAESRRFGNASYALLFLVMDRLLEAGTGVVVESNFRRGVAEPELASRVARAAAAALVHCEADPDRIRVRVRVRAGSPERHRVHPDIHRLDDLVRELGEGRSEPLALDREPIRVDTSDGYRPPLDDIVSRIREAIRSDEGRGHEIADRPDGDRSGLSE